MQCSINQTTTTQTMARTRTEQAPKETREQKAEREQKRAQFAALQLAKYGDPLAAIRAANPKQEIVTGSPYQAAREAWVNPAALSQGAFDHWTSQTD